LGINVYDIKEVAEMLGVTAVTVHRYIKNGTLDARKLGGRWHITEETIRSFIGGAEKGVRNCAKITCTSAR
jgi:excisionase family DNA binding protein